MARVKRVGGRKYLADGRLTPSFSYSIGAERLDATGHSFFLKVVGVACDDDETADSYVLQMTQRDMLYVMAFAAEQLAAPGHILRPGDIPPERCAAKLKELATRILAVQARSVIDKHGNV